MPDLGRSDWSSEAWERCRREASFFQGAGGVIAKLRPDGSAAQLVGTGHTTTEAMQALARALTRWDAQHTGRGQSA